MSTSDLDQWLAEHEPALARLVRQAGEDGVRLDRTPGSLTGLVEWLLRVMRPRPEGESVAGAPDWSARFGFATYWSDDTLRLLEDAGHYYGEVLLRSVPTARWKMGHDRHPGYVDEGQVVLDVGGYPVNPVRIVSSSAVAVRGGYREVSALQETHDATVEEARTSEAT